MIGGFGTAGLPDELVDALIAQSARHVAARLMLLSFVLLAAAYVPRNGIRMRVHRPMLPGVRPF